MKCSVEILAPVRNCEIGMQQILIWADFRPAGYPANLTDGYRISGKAGYRKFGSK
jgi:hypothetical protein